MYRPVLYATSAWPELLTRFEMLTLAIPELAPLQALSAQIAASPYAAELYPSTSMLTLSIVQHERFEYGRDMIEIDYWPRANPANGTPACCFELRYWERPDRAPGWVRRGPDGWSLFETLLRHLGWFPGLLPRAPEL